MKCEFCNGTGEHNHAISRMHAILARDSTRRKVQDFIEAEYAMGDDAVYGRLARLLVLILADRQMD